MNLRTLGLSTVAIIASAIGLHGPARAQQAPWRANDHVTLTIERVWNGSTAPATHDVEVRRVMEAYLATLDAEPQHHSTTTLERKVERRLAGPDAVIYDLFEASIVSQDNADSGDEDSGDEGPQSTEASTLGQTLCAPGARSATAAADASDEDKALAEIVAQDLIRVHRWCTPDGPVAPADSPEVLADDLRSWLAEAIGELADLRINRDGDAWAVTATLAAVEPRVELSGSLDLVDGRWSLSLAGTDRLVVDELGADQTYALEGARICTQTP